MGGLVGGGFCGVLVRGFVFCVWAMIVPDCIVLALLSLLSAAVHQPIRSLISNHCTGPIEGRVADLFGAY